jgi:tRNA(Ile)-lysidine synthase
MAELSPSLPLGPRFTKHLRSRPWFDPGERFVVAVSGGLDSVVLLHLLRFADFRTELVVAHFDHRMRSTSKGDRRWVEGLSRAWRVEFVSARAEEPLNSEAAAREARYRFLEAVRQDSGARWVLTAHHADDQAETVLQRAFRGTGPDGLVGIRETRDPGIARPLLPFHRTELESYAATARLSHRRDPTNLDSRFTRNWIRRVILPRLDERLGISARRALARLGRLSALDAEAWSSVLDPIESGLLLPGDEEDIVVGVESLLALHPGVQARLVRRFASRLGVSLDAQQTESVMSFVETAKSGGVLSPRAALRVRRDFDRVVFSASGESTASEEFGIDEAACGSGRLSLGMRRYSVRWASGELEACPGGCAEQFSSELRYPLRVRAWHPGDRMSFDFGSKKLKKIFGEARVSVRDRGSAPVLVDSEDSVLWVPGVARSVLALPRRGETPITICIEEEDS